MERRLAQSDCGGSIWFVAEALASEWGLKLIFFIRKSAAKKALNLLGMGTAMNYLKNKQSWHFNCKQSITLLTNLSMPLLAAKVADDNFVLFGTLHHKENTAQHH